MSRGGDYAAKVREGTQRYVQDLIAEGQRLRVQVASLDAQMRLLEQRASLAEASQQEGAALRALVGSLESETARLQAQLLRAREEHDRQREEQARLHARLVGIEQEGSRLSEQYAYVEQQNSNLASLYVASYRLHSTLDRAELLEAILEILANLVGSEEVAVFELAERERTLRLLTSQGVDPERYRQVALDSGPIGRAVATGVPYLAADGPEAPDGQDSLSACIPLKLQERVTGAIAIFRLLPQKQGLGALDRDLFDLLAAHAAMALYSTSLHAAASAGGRA